jgi:hypothetical protein
MRSRPRACAQLRHDLTIDASSHASAWRFLTSFIHVSRMLQKCSSRFWLALNSTLDASGLTQHDSAGVLHAERSWVLDLAQYISGGTASQPIIHPVFQQPRHCTQTISRPRPNTTHYRLRTVASRPDLSTPVTVLSNPIDALFCMTPPPLASGARRALLLNSDAKQPGPLTGCFVQVGHLPRRWRNKPLEAAANTVQFPWVLRRTPGGQGAANQSWYISLGKGVLMAPVQHGSDDSSTGFGSSLFFGGSPAPSTVAASPAPGEKGTLKLCC